jgi:hypothetical protein
MIDWDGLARQKGYADRVAMFTKLYKQDKMSLSNLSEYFQVGRNSIRAALTAAGVPMRERGGRNFQKTIINDELLQEIEVKGVPTVAQERGIDYSGLYKALQAYRRSRGLGPSPEGLGIAPEQPDVAKPGQ